MSLAEIRLEMARAGLGAQTTFSFEDVVTVVHRAGTASLERLNKALAIEITADRKQIFEALRSHPGCLMRDEDIRRLVGVEP
jgi:hypothetical protein